MLHHDGDIQTTIESCRYTVYSFHSWIFIHIFFTHAPQFYAVNWTPIGWCKAIHVW
jgi:hypothetical protein